LDDFTVRPVGGDRITPLDHDEELREMVRCAAASAVGTTDRSWRSLRGLRLRDSPLYPWYVPFHHAYAAALLGHEEAVGPLVRAAMHPHGELKMRVFYHLAGDRMRAAMRAFHRGSQRSEFLAALEEAHALYPGSGGDWEVMSLIGPLKRELAQGPPAYVRRRPGERSEEEQIRALIYEVRESSAYGDWGLPGSSGRPDPARQLIQMGQKVIPYVIEILEDYTPTRAMITHRRTRLLRRMDVAMHVIEAIAGCDLYREASTSGELHNDTPERRSSAVENVKKWWAMSEGASQAEMIRNQLSLWDTNKSLRIYERRKAVYHLALIAGPDGALSEIMKLPDDDDNNFGSWRASTRRMAMFDADTRLWYRDEFDRFWKREPARIDFASIFRFGDRRVYAELARRFEATGALDHTKGDKCLHCHLDWAAADGRNWAIPILAHALALTEMRRERKSGGAVRRYADADIAAEEFQKLVGRDFGYRKEDDQEKRLAAIRKAREWWLAEGRRALAEKIAEDHPPGKDSGDLFMSDKEIEACVAAISGDDAELRRKTIAGLGQAFDYRSQRALMDALAREADAETRAAIIRALTPHARPWHLPPVVRAMEEDGDPSARVEAAKLVAKVRPLGNWWNLEPCIAAVKAARSVAQDRDAPVEVRRAAAEVLMSGWSWGAGWLEEFSLLRELAADPVFADFEKLQRYVGEKEETLRRMREARDQKNQ